MFRLAHSLDTVPNARGPVHGDGPQEERPARLFCIVIYARCPPDTRDHLRGAHDPALVQDERADPGLPCAARS